MSEKTAKSIDSFSTKELTELRAATDRELQAHIESLNTLRVVARRLEEAKVLVRNIAERGGQSEVLVPLSNNLFVAGKLEAAEGFIVDMGAGYYARLNSEATLRNTETDLGYVRGAIEAQSSMLGEKQRLREQMQLQLKLRELRGREEANRAGS